MINMAKIDKPMALGNFKLDWLLYQLCRGRNFKITDQSQNNFYQLADALPAGSKPLITNLFRFNYLAVRVIELKMPKELIESQNEKVLQRLGETIYMFNLINTYRVLDLQWVTMKSQLAFDYDSKPFYEDVRRSYIESDGRMKQFETEETKTRVLYDNLMRIKYYLNFLGCLKYVARVEVKAEFDQAANKELFNLSAYLRQMSNEFPLSEEVLPPKKPEPKQPRRIRTTEKKELKTARDHFEHIIGVLEKGNNTSADSTLLGLTEKLMVVLKSTEKKRGGEKRGSDLTPPENPYEENLWHLLRRTQKVLRSEDGKLIVPQYHFVKVDGAWVRKLLPHKLEDEEAAVRAEQHKLESVAAEIGKNKEYQRMFTALEKELKGGGINYERALMLLRKSFNAYERGEHAPKIDVKHRVQWASEMLRLVTACKEAASRSRLLAYAGGFMNLAARQLSLLTGILQEQLPGIIRKEALLSQLADQHNMRDEELRSFSMSLQRSLTHAEYMRSIKAVNQLAERIEGMRSFVRVGESADNGTFYCEQSLTNVMQLLNDIRRLLYRKSGLFKEIKRLKAESKEKLIKEAPLKFEALRKTNEEIVEIMVEAMKETLLIDYYLDNRSQGRDPKRERGYISQFEKVYGTVKKLNSGYMKIYSGKDEVGEAQMFEATVLGFSIKPVVS